MTLGEKLKTCRKWANLTQKELGEKIGIDGATVGKYERGILKPKRETLMKFEDALNYAHGTFYRETDEAFQNAQDAINELYGTDEWAEVSPDARTCTENCTKSSKHPVGSSIFQTKCRWKVRSC